MLTLVSTQSCTVDRDEIETAKLSTDKYFSPPTWIQGTWKYNFTGNPLDSPLTLRFETSDIVSISSGGTETSWTKKFENSTYNEEVTESVSESTYNLQIKTSNGTEVWEFKRISNTELEYRVSPVLNWTKLIKI